MGQSSFGRDGEDALGIGFEGWMVESEVFKEGLEGGEPLVAGAGRISPPLLFVFEVMEKSEKSFNVQILNGNGFLPAAFGKYKSEEEFKGVAVALERVRA